MPSSPKTTTPLLQIIGTTFFITVRLLTQGSISTGSLRDLYTKGFGVSSRGLNSQHGDFGVYGMILGQPVL